MFNQKMNIYRVEGSSLKSDPMRVLGNPLYKLFLNYKKRKDFYPIISPVIDRVAHSTPRLQNTWDENINISVNLKQLYL